MPESRDVVERCVRLREGEGQGFREDFQRREHFLNGGPRVPRIMLNMLQTLFHSSLTDL